ncbi:MAG: hypothetical protein ACQEXJ_00560 [Myxococcota bacterium]
MASKPGTFLRRRVERVLGRARESLNDREDLSPEVQEAGLKTLDRADRVLARLEGAAGALETAARLELELLRKLTPIVDDLGELVRHTLDEARERRGPGARRRRRRRDRDRDIIDVDPE